MNSQNANKFLRRFIIGVFLLLLAVGCGGEESPETAVSLPTPTIEPTEEIIQYLDPTATTASRVEDLLARMTLAEKIGQMTLVEKNSIQPNDITDLGIGALLSGGGGYPTTNTPEAWAEMVGAYQEEALQSRLGIPLLYGVDAVHGHNNVKGATIFPHNIGLGATRNPALLEQIGRATAVEVAATGIFWNYAPAVTVPQDIRWGRTYEGYSENSDVVTELGTAYLRGLQGDDLSDPLTVLGTPKHFVGDGGTTWGTSGSEGYELDRGDTQVDEAMLRAVHLPPYPAVIDAGAMNIMVSYSSWNGRKLHGHDYLLTDILKGELEFTGFLVSDWQAIDEINSNYYDAVVQAINAGVDMNMVPFEYDLFIQALTAAVENGDVSLERIDDAVRRILTVKFKLGLFENPHPNPDYLDLVGSDEHRELARQAVRESLVLLKNEGNTLPLAKDAPLIFVAGEAADDIGIQSGGWTIEWQGKAGNITPGTTLLDGIENTVTATTAVHYNRFGKYDRVTDENGDLAMADIGIVFVGERPYAEGVGDSDDLSLTETDINLISRVRDRSHKLVVIIISGRPLIITDQLEMADSFVAAWLPGTEGQGIADVLFGDFPFTGQLSYTWPRTMEQLPLGAASSDPLFPFGYGLRTE